MPIHTPEPCGHRPRKPYPRVRGAVLLLIGLGLDKWQIYDPLYGQGSGATEVTISSALLALAILLSVLGLALMLAGHGVAKFAEDLLMDPRRLTWKSGAFLLLMVAIAAAAWVLVQMGLEARGFY